MGRRKLPSIPTSETVRSGQVSFFSIDWPLIMATCYVRSFKRIRDDFGIGSASGNDRPAEDKGYRSQQPQQQKQLNRLFPWGTTGLVDQKRRLAYVSSQNVRLPCTLARVLLKQELREVLSKRLQDMHVYEAEANQRQYQINRYMATGLYPNSVGIDFSPNTVYCELPAELVHGVRVLFKPKLAKESLSSTAAVKKASKSSINKWHQGVSEPSTAHLTTVKQFFLEFTSFTQIGLRSTKLFYVSYSFVFLFDRPLLMNENHCFQCFSQHFNKAFILVVVGQYSLPNMYKTSGDQILTWNGVPLTGKTYEEVQQIVDNSQGEIEIVIRRNVTGYLLLRLQYEKSTQTLFVTVVKARNLATQAGNRSGYRNPFVKIYLLPDRKVENKRRTRFISNTCNPEWNQTVVYKDVSENDLALKYLEFTVWDFDRIRENTFLGKVVLILTGKGFREETSMYFIFFMNFCSHISDPSIQWGKMLWYALQSKL
ncbi:unnamed protein product [Soboliphyme baturini]|uniref:C2 domain-containing protein n=1 Tax=Soboliphyme baturini TaxID=241478 RepID=A0A183IBM3_9BILA|nr:unnamed protein product [Soboliphyme baturini]